MAYCLIDDGGRYVTSPYYFPGPKEEAREFPTLLEARIIKNALEKMDGRNYQIIERK